MRFDISSILKVSKLRRSPAAREESGDRQFPICERDRQRVELLVKDLGEERRETNYRHCRCFVRTFWGGDGTP